MNPQQLAMENRVLRGEKQQLLQVIENMRAAREKDTVLEKLLAAGVAGYGSQPRAASEIYFKKDEGSGVVVPLDGGPKWVAQMAVSTMNFVFAAIEGTLAAPQKDHEDQEAVTEGSSEGTTTQEAGEAEASEADRAGAMGLIL